LRYPAPIDRRAGETAVTLSRRILLATGTALLTLPAIRAQAAGSTKLPRITVWKAANCGCCVHWVEHLTQAGFPTEVHEVEDMDPVKARLGVAADVASCHTGQVEGYFVEGHVPASAIKRLLAERPQAKGLAVPGMPAGSPGMEIGDTKVPYDVLLVAAGGPTVYERH
jgi:hypothetical protein